MTTMYLIHIFVKCGIVIPWSDMPLLCPRRHTQTTFVKPFLRDNREETGEETSTHDVYQREIAKVIHSKYKMTKRLGGIRN